MLGEATKNIVANGRKVLIMDLKYGERKSMVAELGKEKVIFNKTDVKSESQVKAFGTVYICVNCAGIGVAKIQLAKKAHLI